MAPPKKNKWLNLRTQLKTMADREWNKRLSKKETYTKSMPKASTLTKEKAAQLSDYLFQFKKNWSENDKQKILKEQHVVKGFYDFLVPDDVSEKDFWQRYGWRCDQELILKDFEALPPDEFAKLVEAASEHTQEVKSRAYALPSKKTARLPDVLMSPVKSVKPAYDRSSILKHRVVPPSTDSSKKASPEEPEVNPLYTNVLKKKTKSEENLLEAKEEVNAMTEQVDAMLEETETAKNSSEAVSSPAQPSKGFFGWFGGAKEEPKSDEKASGDTDDVAQSQTPAAEMPVTPETENLESPQTETSGKTEHEDLSEAAQAPVTSIEAETSPEATGAEAENEVQPNEKATAEEAQTMRDLDLEMESGASDIDSQDGADLLKEEETNEAQGENSTENQATNEEPQIQVQDTPEIQSSESNSQDQVAAPTEDPTAIPAETIASASEEQPQAQEAMNEESQIQVRDAGISGDQPDATPPVPNKASIMSRLSESFLSPGTLKQIGTILDKKTTAKEEIKAGIPPPDVATSSPGKALQENSLANEAEPVQRGSDVEKSDVMKRISNALFSPSTHQRTLDLEIEEQKLLLKEKLKEIDLDFDDAMDTQDFLVQQAVETSNRRGRTVDSNDSAESQGDEKSKAENPVDMMKRVSEVLFGPNTYEMTLDLERDEKKRLLKEKLKEMDLDLDDEIDSQGQTQEMLVAQAKEKMVAPVLDASDHDPKAATTDNEGDLVEDSTEAKMEEQDGPGLLDKLRESFSVLPAIHQLSQLSLEEEKEQQMKKLKTEFDDLNDDIDVSMSRQQQILQAKKSSMSLESIESNEEVGEVVLESSSMESAVVDNTTMMDEESPSNTGQVDKEQAQIIPESQEEVEVGEKSLKEKPVDIEDVNNPSSSNSLFGWFGGAKNDTEDALDQEKGSVAEGTETAEEKNVGETAPDGNPAGIFSFLQLPKSQKSNQEGNNEDATEQPNLLQLGPEAAEEAAHMIADNEESRLQSEAKARCEAEEEAIQKAEDEKTRVEQEEQLRQQAEEDARIKFDEENNRLAGEAEERKMAEEDARLQADGIANHGDMEKIARDHAEESARAMMEVTTKESDNVDENPSIFHSEETKDKQIDDIAQAPEPFNIGESTEDAKGENDASSSKGFLGWFSRKKKDVKSQETAGDGTQVALDLEKETVEASEGTEPATTSEVEPEQDKEATDEEKVGETAPDGNPAGIFSFLQLPKSQNPNEEGNNEDATEQPNLLQLGPEAAEEAAHMTADNEESRLQLEAKARGEAEEEAVQKAEDETSRLEQEEQLRQQAEEDARIKFDEENHRLDGEAEERKMAEEDARLQADGIASHGDMEKIARDHAEESARAVMATEPSSNETAEEVTSVKEEKESEAVPSTTGESAEGVVPATDTSTSNDENIVKDLAAAGATNVEQSEAAGNYSEASTGETKDVTEESSDAIAQEIEEETPSGNGGGTDEKQELEGESTETAPEGASKPAQTSDEPVEDIKQEIAHEDGPATTEEPPSIFTKEAPSESTTTTCSSESPVLSTSSDSPKKFEEQHLQLLTTPPTKKPNGTVTSSSRRTPQEREAKRQRVKALVKQLDLTLQKSAAVGQ